MNKTPYFLLRVVFFVLLVFLLKFTFTDAHPDHPLELAYSTDKSTHIDKKIKAH